MVSLSVHVNVWGGEVGTATAVTEQHCALLHTHTEMMMMMTAYTYTAMMVMMMMMMMIMIRKYFIGKLLDAAVHTVRTVLPVEGSTLQCPLHKLQCG
jgi:hypothetical protein